MANPDHLEKLKEGTAAWNVWRERNPDVVPDLFAAELSGSQLTRANLRSANLCGARLIRANLVEADLSNANLGGAQLTGAILSGARLCSADLNCAYLAGADLVGARDLESANVDGAYFKDAKVDRHVIERSITSSKVGEKAPLAADEGRLVGSGGGERRPSRFFARMPGSVRLAVASLVLMLAVSGLAIPLLERPHGIVEAPLVLLILWGVFRRHRLAWQWGRLLCALDAVCMTIVFALSALRPGEVEPSVTAFALALIVPLYVTFFAFGFRSAREYFRLVCPSCGELTRKAADFFFNKARCTACRHVW